MTPRQYVPNPKHKGRGTPDSFHAKCPPDINLIIAQNLLDNGAVSVDGASVFNLHDGRPYRAREHAPGKFHGYPIAPNEVPPKILRKWKDEKRISGVQYTRWRKGRLS